MIQYSGNVRKITGISGGASRQDLINTICDNLEVCGWTVSSGEGTGTVVLYSGTTPQGFKMKIKLHTNLNAAVMGFAVMNYAETRTQTADAFSMCLKWGTQYTYTMIGSPYQVYIFGPGIAYNEALAFGVPWIPSWLVASTSNVIWGASCTSSDQSTSYYNCWRDLGSLIGNPGSWAVIIDDILCENRNDGSWRSGGPHLFVPCSADMQSNPTVSKWVTGHFPAWDPIISVSVNGNRDAEPRLVGQLWDAFWTNTSEFSIDSVIRFDNHDYQVISGPYAGNATYGPKGQLLAATSNS